MSLSHLRANPRLRTPLIKFLPFCTLGREVRVWRSRSARRGARRWLRRWCGCRWQSVGSSEVVDRWCRLVGGDRCCCRGSSRCVSVVRLALGFCLPSLDCSRFYGVTNLGLTSFLHSAPRRRTTTRRRRQRIRRVASNLAPRPPRVHTLPAHPSLRHLRSRRSWPRLVRRGPK